MVHFPETREISSSGSGYGGNALLGKKCFGLRIASNIARDEGWLAEHMLILGVEDPHGERTYISAAFPSACGKTNLAMLVPPDAMSDWKITMVGDDIAWLKPDATGRLRAINPEAGVFGVAPGTSRKTNPNAMATIARNTIFTNVALTPEGGVWWEGIDDPPAECLDWRGEREPRRLGEPQKTGGASERPVHGARGAVPDHRRELGVARGRPDQRHRLRRAPRAYGADGVSGVQLDVGRVHRRDHGVGDDRGGDRQRRNPAARSDGDAAVLRLSHGGLLQALDQDAARPQRDPQDFHVNWFRKDSAGGFLWPGYRENMRVLKWIVDRVHGRVPTKETPIGWMPRYEDIDWRGLPLPREQFDELQRVDPALWRREVIQHEELFIELHDHLPPEMIYERELFICRLWGAARFARGRGAHSLRTSVGATRFARA